MERKQTHLMYGGLTGLVIVILLVGLYVSGNYFKAGLSSLAYLILLVGIILNAVNYSKANNADVTFGQAFGSCFKATALAILIVTVWNFISFYVFPQLESQCIDLMREKAMAQLKTDEQKEAVEKGMSLITGHVKLIIVGGTAFYHIIAGVIFSLIAAAVAKKNPQPIYQG